MFAKDLYATCDSGRAGDATPTEGIASDKLVCPKSAANSLCKFQERRVRGGFACCRA